MKQTLQVRLSQHLALTPQLQQSIRLLQLSTLELHQEVEQMLEQNPFLEVEEETAPAFEPLAEPLSVAERAGERESERAAEPGGDGPDAGEADRDRRRRRVRRRPRRLGERHRARGLRRHPRDAVGDADQQRLRRRRRRDRDRDTVAQTLQDHLRSQLAGMRLAPADAAAVLVLIDSLDDDGYLADSLEDIAARLVENGLVADLGQGEDSDGDPLEPVVAQLRCALRFLQSMEPTGIGAHDLAECLTLQLRTRERSEAQAIAIIVCKNHLPLLARRDLKKLMAVTGADETLLREAQAMIVALEPKPARPFARAEANIVVPDVIVQRSGRSWKVQLNPDVMPKLRINDLYASAIRQHRGSGALNGAGPALNSRLQEARWFVKNILQRFDTIQRVSQAIVERQKSFFTHGAIAMKPLVLREIADELGLHESTISRVTTAKYMATPFGTFELKYFFGSSLGTDAGGTASSTAVRALIRQIVAAEDPTKPLSDSQISQMLDEQGIHVARRTVAKYREALKIAPTQLRKAM
jgi:RNA polymerase sigma-54 factor